MDVQELKNKKIAILGYGREGVALAKFFGAHDIAFDIRDKNPDIGAPPGQEGVTFGKNYLKNLDKYQLIFRSPGIPRLTPELVAAERKGTEISSLTKLFFELCPSPIIGVTGTKGKGTTASFIYEILKAAGRDVYLGGNIGKPAIEFLSRLNKDSWVILELSSFQLQDLGVGPHIAVVLPISSDHLDHHLTTEEYMEAKKNIIKYQIGKDFAILDSSLAQFAAATKAQVMRLDVIDFGEIDFANLKLQGEHNRQNARFAVAVGQVLQIDKSIIQEAINYYAGLPHRLEFIAELDGVKYYNDSLATEPSSAIAAIKTFAEPKILILGGSDKGADYMELVKKISTPDVRGVILMGETGKKIGKLLHAADYQGDIIENISKMTEAVDRAKKIARPGDIVLLSPASASFGLFKNYEDRGEQFKTNVKRQ